MEHFFTRTAGFFEPIPDREASSYLFDLPEGAKYGLVLAHGAGAGMRHKNMEAIAQALLNRRIAVFRFQFLFMEWGKGREASQVSIQTVVAAVNRAITLAPELVWWAGGHSYGGRMTSHAAADGILDKTVGLVFFSFPLHPAGKPSVERAEHLKHIKLPMLFLSGTRDALANWDLLAGEVEQLGDNAQLHPLETADHGYKILKTKRNLDLDIFEEMAKAVFRAFEAGNNKGEVS